MGFFVKPVLTAWSLNLKSVRGDYGKQEIDCVSSVPETEDCSTDSEEFDLLPVPWGYICPTK